jgi:exodeoxyribonuclease-3
VTSAIAKSGLANAPGTASRSDADCDPALTRSSLPANPDDRQARYVEAAVNGVLIVSIYLPNGNPQPGPKFGYKLAWFQRLIDHGAELMKAGVPVILAGDYNVVPAAQDIYPTDLSTRTH